jgi:zinc D-Ala-D-Ala carboxypeptidase
MKREFDSNFSDAELTCKCGCGMLPRPPAVLRLQALRNRVARPLILTSAARCYEHNKEVGGAPSSRHVPENGGDAFDIAVSGGAERGEIVETALAMGFKGIGVAEDFVHVDLRDELTVWTY